MAERQQIQSILPLALVHVPSSIPSEPSSAVRVRGHILPPGLGPVLIQTLPVPVLVVDEDFHLALVNDAFRRLVSESTVGDDVARWLSRQLLEEQRILLRNGEEPRTHIDCLRLGERSRTVRVHTELLQIEERELLCLVLQEEGPSESTTELTTESKTEPVEAPWGAWLGAAVQERLRVVYRRKTLGQLANSLAHEFNNMLSVIMASLELSKRAFDKQLDPSRDLERALRAAERSAEAIGDILRFSRHSTNQQVMIAPSEMLLQLRGSLERCLGRHAELVVEVLPTGLLQTARSLFETALLNLVLNARDAMDGPGTVWLVCEERTLGAAEAAVASVREGRYVSLRVSDNGAGVAPSLHNRIFEPFFTTKSSEQNSGLGLSTVRDLVQSSGGALIFQSEEGRGTTVELLLPVVSDGL